VAGGVSEPPARIRLSALVVAHDEERQLAECLERLTFADEIVVVLDRCTDGSRTVAERFTDRILEGAWPLEGARRNAGLDLCRGDWVLEIDADERVPPALASEIRALLAGEPAWAAFPIPFDNYVGRRLVRWGWGASFGVSAAIRLTRHGAKRWGMQRVHPKITIEGPVGPHLEHRVDHFVDDSISDMIRRLDRYTSARAADMRAAGDRGRLGPDIRRILSRFWKCFVARRGYREGAWGFLIALLASLYPVLSTLKARLETDEGPRDQA
jgi:glycosyltransferase involved in cell wall biosynthesis